MLRKIAQLVYILFKIYFRDPSKSPKCPYWWQSINTLKLYYFFRIRWSLES